MEFAIDREYLLETMKEFINTPSPVGYYLKVNSASGEICCCSRIFGRIRS